MKKKNFLSGISAKIALLVLAVSGALMTGCYKDDGLDAQEPTNPGDLLKSAVYTISGTVTDITTGVNLSDYELTVDAGGSTYDLKKSDGSYTLKFEQFPEGVTEKSVALTFKKTGYNNDEVITKSVVMYRVKDGNAVNYPLSVAMKPNGVKLVDVVYNLSFTVKDAETGVELDRTKFNPEVAPAAAEGGNYVSGIYTVRTFNTTIGAATYLPSSTTVELAAKVVKEGENNVMQRTIVLYVTKATAPVEPEETYVNFAGSIVDKYGKLLQAEEVKLFKQGGTQKGQTLVNASNFRFTIENSEAVKEYYVEAKIGTELVKSSVYNINGGNIDCTLMFSNIGDVDPVDPIQAKYNIYVNVLDANTKSAISGAAIKINGGVFNDKLMNQDPGVYTIDVTAAGYHDAKSMVVLEEVFSDKATTINYVATVYMTPSTEEVVYANISGLIVDKKGKTLKATKIELFKTGQSNALKTLSDNSNFRFTVATKGGGEYWVKATYTKDGQTKTAESTKYDINGGNVDCTLVFDDVDLDPVVPEETENAKYNLYVNVLAAGTNEKINNFTIEIVDPIGGKTNADKLLNIDKNYGVYTVNVSADKYYSTTTMVDLVELEVVKGSPVINKIVTVYLTKMDDPVITPTKLILAGDVYDNRNILAKSQSIKLLNANKQVIDAVYGVDHYKFEVTLAQAKAAQTWTVVAEVINADATGVVKASTKYTYTDGMTELYSAISFPVKIEDGKVVKDDETSTVTPPQDDKGEVTNEVTTVIDKGQNEQTTLKIEAGTVITNKNNEPVLTSVVVVRDKNEETDPSGSETGEGEQTITTRCYDGYPEGIYFSKPLVFTFTDVYGGQLGALNLEYLENGNWSSDNAKSLDGTSYKDVVLNNNTYTMKVPHFSKFRASIASTTTTDKIELNDKEVKELTIDKTNENDFELQGIKVEYKGKVGGWAFDKPIEDVVKEKFSNASAQKVVVAAIKNYLYNQYKVKVANELVETTVLLATIDVPARTYIKSATVKFTKVVMNYTFKLNGIEVPFTVYTYEAVDEQHSGKFEVINWDMISIGHGHGHGHGGNLNAGGGIIVSE